MNAHAVFQCARCGVCCEGKGGIVLAPGDVARLAAHLSMEKAAFLDAWTDPGGRLPALTSGEDGRCSFYVAGTGCGVHPARPNVCRAWPFFRGNLEDADSFAMAKEDCPGIKDVPHETFRCAGLALMQEEGLVQEDETAPNALRIAHLLTI